jgi:hypothetical protein
VQSKVDPRVVRGVFESMVHLSDDGDLFTRFISMPCPHIFMYSEQNASLTYLPILRAHGVDLAEIAFSGHWPMYSNPSPCGPRSWTSTRATSRAGTSHAEGPSPVRSLAAAEP